MRQSEPVYVPGDSAYQSYASGHSLPLLDKGYDGQRDQSAQQSTVAVQRVLPRQLQVTVSQKEMQFTPPRQLAG